MAVKVGRSQSRIILLWHHQNIIVRGAALNCTKKKIAIPAPGITIRQITPKIKKPPSNQHPSMMIGRKGKSTPMIPSGTRARRIVILTDL